MSWARPLAVAALAGGAAAGLVIAWRSPAPRREEVGAPASGGAARPRLRDAVLVAAAAVLLRAALSLVQDGGLYDIFVAYRGVGDRLRHGGDVFVPPSLGLSNYPPLIYWWWAAATAIVPSGHDHLFAAVVRAPFWLADAAIAPVLLLLARGARGARAAWVYALNPITAAAATLHGQFDSLVILPLLPAVSVVGRGPARAGALTGLAASVKTWPLFFTAQLLGCLPRRRWPRFLAAAAAAPLAAFCLYGAVHPHHLLAGLQRVVLYGPNRQGLGTGFLFPTGVSYYAFVTANVAAGAAVLGAAVLAARRRLLAPESLALGMCVLLTLSPTVSDQYVTWPLAFLLLAGRLRLAAVLSAGLLPAVASLDLWVSQNDGQAPVPLLALATASTAAAAAALLAPPPWRRRQRGRPPERHPVSLPA